MKRLGPALACLIVGLISFTLLIPLALYVTRDDSGIAACQDLLASNSDPTYYDKRISHQAYEEKLRAFKASRHKDLRLAGMSFVNALYEMNKKAHARVTNDADAQVIFLALLMYVKYDALQSACSNHGVDISV